MSGDTLSTAARDARRNWPLALVHRGRFWLIFEPRDLWVGAYVAAKAVYVCPVPCVVLKWDRR